MKIYIEGNLSRRQQNFLMKRIFFASDKTYPKKLIGGDCFALEGQKCEACLSDDKTKFFCEWDGVNIKTEMYDGETFNTSIIVTLLEDGKYKMAGVDAEYDTAVQVTITFLEIRDGIFSIKLDPNGEVMKDNMVELQ